MTHEACRCRVTIVYFNFYRHFHFPRKQGIDPKAAAPKWISANFFLWLQQQKAEEKRHRVCTVVGGGRDGKGER
jgi:hypothetical protein